jgi:hypothetical protein
VGQEQRRHDRYTIQLRAEILKKSGATEVATENVSLGGFFVAAPRPPPLQTLLKFRVALPEGFDPKGRRIVLNGATVHSGASERGVGVRLYPMADTDRELWSGFIRWLKQINAAPLDEAV